MLAAAPGDRIVSNIVVFVIGESVDCQLKVVPSALIAKPLTSVMVKLVSDMVRLNDFGQSMCEVSGSFTVSPFIYP